MSTLRPHPALPQRGRGIWQIVLLLALVLAACQQAASPSIAQPTQLPGTPRPTATPAATPSPAPGLALDHVGAAASPNGFTAFAVLNNPTALTALDVKVEIAELDAHGQVVTRKDASIARIGAGQREAVAVAFPVGRALPDQFSGSIGEVRWSSDSSPDIARVASASFIQDARTPTVRIHVVNDGQGAARVILVAVCWDGDGNIRGGGTRTATVPPGAEGHDVMVAAWIATVPTRCDGYSITVS